MGSAEIDSRPPSYVVNLVSDDEAVDEDVEGDEDERGTDEEEDFAGGTQGFEDFYDGRRFLSDARKDDWTLEEERMFYETYLSADGNMKKVCDAMERAPYARDRKLVQKFRFNATRRLQRCLQSLNLSLDTKDKREVLEAFRSYWKFRQAEGLEGESVRAFGQRLGLKVDGFLELQEKCAEALRRDLCAAGLRPEWARLSRVRIDGARFVHHAKSKVWCASFNNCTADDLAIIERGPPRINRKVKVRWMAVGIEHGPLRPGGRTEERSVDDVDIEDLPLLHLQVSLQTERATTWCNMATWVETYLSTPGHIEPSNGSLDDNRRDCSKTGNFREYGDAEPFDAARAATPGKRNDLGNFREYGDAEPFDAARAAKPGKRDDIEDKDETAISTKRIKPNEDSLNDTDCMKIRVIFSEISFHPSRWEPRWLALQLARTHYTRANSKPKRRRKVQTHEYTRNA